MNPTQNPRRVLLERPDSYHTLVTRFFTSSNDIDAAAWEIFRMRWQAVTGEEIA